MKKCQNAISRVNQGISVSQYKAENLLQKFKKIIAFEMFYKFRITIGINTFAISQRTLVLFSRKYQTNIVIKHNENNCVLTENGSILIY